MSHYIITRVKRIITIRFMYVLSDITELHGSAKHCCMGHSAKHRKQANFDPLWNKNASTDQYQIWQGWPRWGAHAIGKKFCGSVERWRPHAVTVCQTCVTSFSPFFPHPAYRSDATFACHVLCIKRRGSVDTRAFWGKTIWNSHFGGLRPPKPPIPPTGKSHLKQKCLITF